MGRISGVTASKYDLFILAFLLASGWWSDCYVDWTVVTISVLFGIDDIDISEDIGIYGERGYKENLEGLMLLWDSLIYMLSLAKASILSLSICQWLLRCFFPSSYLYINNWKRVDNNCHSPPHKSKTENILNIPCWSIKSKIHFLDMSSSWSTGSSVCSNTDLWECSHLEAASGPDDGLWNLKAPPTM